MTYSCSSSDEGQRGKKPLWFPGKQRRPTRLGRRTSRRKTTHFFKRIGALERKGGLPVRERLLGRSDRPQPVPGVPRPSQAGPGGEQIAGETRRIPALGSRREPRPLPLAPPAGLGLIHRVFVEETRGHPKALGVSAPPQPRDRAGLPGGGSGGRSAAAPPRKGPFCRR